MWPILGPIEYNQAHRSTNFNNFPRTLFTGKSPNDRMIQTPYNIHSKSHPSSSSARIISNIRYNDPISSTCLIIYSLILLLLCALPIFALNIYLPQAFETFHQTYRLQVYD